jgi:DNA-directed RNA polymerase subunit M/transcription elongation factor TFIIS
MSEVRQTSLSDLKEILSEKTASNVEKSIYNWSIQFANEVETDASWENPIFSHAYNEKLIDVIFYLNKFDLKEKIQNKEILSKDVAFLDYKLFNKDRWKPVVHETKLNSNDGIFQCKKCKSKKTTYYSLQTRSADEPMTNFITCLVCNNRWKM